jgi:hypothetical protein
MFNTLVNTNLVRIENQCVYYSARFMQQRYLNNNCTTNIYLFHLIDLNYNNYNRNRFQHGNLQYQNNEKERIMFPNNAIKISTTLSTVPRRNFSVIRRRRGQGGQNFVEKQQQEQKQQKQQRDALDDSNNVDTYDNYDVDDDDDLEEMNKNMFVFQRRGLVTDKIVFEVESKKQVQKLIKSLRPLELINDPFIVTESYTPDIGPLIEIDLGPLYGKYSIQFDIISKLQLQFISPISGHYIYSCYVDSSSDSTSSTTSDWCSIIDGHNFEGMLVRDLIKQIQGVPNL